LDTSAAAAISATDTAIVSRLAAGQQHAVAQVFTSSVGTLFLISAVIMPISLVLSFFVTEPGC
jgi:hypothetical protein